MLTRTAVIHSSVARAEIAFSIGCLDPSHRATSKRRAALALVLDRMPEKRRFAPSNGAWVEGALLAGVLARLQGYDADNRRRLLNDALIFMTARERGATLVTGNVGDMDFLSALRPDVKLLLYRH
jgi:predicted nucleic acid-binding protein